MFKNKQSEALESQIEKEVQAHQSAQAPIGEAALSGANLKIFSREYWFCAANELKSIKTLVIASLIIALRVAVKSFKIPLAASLFLTFDCYINSIGSMIYGPVVALICGAVSDTLGVLIFPSGAYFFPFIFVEMSSSFIFALFLWRKNISVPRIVLSKFTVNLFCNIILTSAIIKFQYYFYGDENFYTYNLINGVRIAKNLILFPLEATIISIIFTAVMPIMKKFHIVNKEQKSLEFRKKDITLIVLTTLVSVALIVLYVFFLKDYISNHNIKLF